jgi:hypothetical protein
VGDEPGRVVGVVDDVDLLAVQLGGDGPHPRADRADAGALRVQARHGRPDGDLGAVAGLAGQRHDLHRPVGDLRDLEREQPADQLGWVRDTVTCAPRGPRVTPTTRHFRREPCV